MPSRNSLFAKSQWPRLVVHPFNASTQEMEAGRLRFQVRIHHGQQINHRYYDLNWKWPLWLIHLNTWSLTGSCCEQAVESFKGTTLLEGIMDESRRLWRLIASPPTSCFLSLSFLYVTEMLSFGFLFLLPSFPTTMDSKALELEAKINCPLSCFLEFVILSQQQ